MIRIACGALGMLLLFPGTSMAHRLDEYLQATKLGLARDGLALELSLTPGVSISAELLALIDRDGDDRITPAEVHVYGAAVLREVVVELDGQKLPLALTEIRVPAVEELRTGMGAVRIDASAPAMGSAGGRHELFYRNNHQPGVSVYLVNALMPDTRAIAIGRQQRDQQQRELRLEYEVTSDRAAIVWTLAAALLLVGLTFSRRNASTQILPLATLRRRW